MFYFQMKVTEIFDLTNSDVENLQSPMEREINKQLEFDNDWDSDQISFYDNGMLCVFDQNIITFRIN